MKIAHDITPVVSEKLAVWPGDVPFRRTMSATLASGDAVDLSSIHTTVHLGAHTDGPNHYRKGTPGIGERSLEPYLGPCQVMAVAVGHNNRVGVHHLTGPILAPRLLFRTSTFPDPTRWNSDFAALSPELVHHLADRGVCLVGIDTPSIDPQHSKLLESHQAVADRDLCILEGIQLDGVQDGLWTLIALPLRLVGLDASPVRAVLLDPA